MTNHPNEATSARPPLSGRATELLDELDANLPQGLVPASIFGDSDIYQAELRRVFGRAWVFMAHESELEANGDYVVRPIGEDNFIVSRDEHGEINVMLDACRHRGVQVCRSDAGNSSHFRCPYHGWTYASDGKLIGAPLWKHALEGMDKESNGLLHAPKVESFLGLVFASLDPSAPPLTEYLGGMAWYLSLVFGLDKDGVEVIGAPQRFIVPANWKSGSDNFSGDDYHLGTLHRSVWDIGAFPVAFQDNMMGYHVQAAPGHSLSFSMAEDPDEPGPNFFGFPDSLADYFDTANISEHQLEIARRARVFVGNVFPNFSVLALPMTEEGDKHEPTGILTMRTWQPKGPGEIEIWNWFLAYKNMTPEQKDRTYRAGLGTFSVGGSFEMDDTEPWISVGQTGRAVAAELMNMQLNYKMGMPGVGMAHPVESEDWPGPGKAYWSRYEEGVQRNLYRYYSALMRAEDGEWPTTELD